MFARILRLLGIKKPQAQFTTKEVLGFGFVVAVFTLSAVLSHIYREDVGRMVIESGDWGIVIFITACILGAVIAPIPSVALVPIAVSAWGSFATALFTTVGWWIGAILAFHLAKKYGRTFVMKMVPLDRAEKIVSRVSGKNQFTVLTLLFVLLPGDILSYAVGIFVPVRMATFISASFLGILITSFVFGYGVALPALHQLIAGTMLFIIAVTVFVKVMR